MILAWHIIGILTIQIAVENIFSIVGILMALCRCHLQIENLDKVIIANKNWPYDLWTNYTYLISYSLNLV
jgi:hypothetical protein